MRKPVITRERPHMYFDVDSTLVEPIKETVSLKQLMSKASRVNIGGFEFRVNQDVIEDLKLCKARGHVVVVWSQGGSRWAGKVINKLGLDSYVDIVMAKPSWYVDDRLPNRILDKSRWYNGAF